MSKSSPVPKFGDWDGEEISYSMYFDNARKGKKSDRVYQIDLQENIEAKSKDQKVSEAKTQEHEKHSYQEEGEMRRSTGSANVAVQPVYDSSYKWPSCAHSRSDKLESEALKAPEVLGPSHDRQICREEGDMRKLTDSPLCHETAGLKNSSNSPYHRHGSLSAGEMPRRVSYQSVGSDRNIDHSPLYPHSQARVRGRTSGISSPSWERKTSSEGSHSLAPSTPGRSRLRSVTRGDNSPDRSPAVPKFGEWDETDPASAEDYSRIFSRVREEKNSETGKVPVMPTESSYSNDQKQYENDNPKGCSCFPWGKK